MYFLVDTGAEKSTIRKLPEGVKEGKRNTMVVGAKGESFKVPILENIEIESEKKLCLNDLLLVPEAEHNLFGRDLIIRLGLEIKSQGGELKIQLYTLTQEDEGEIDPQVWYQEGDSGKVDMEPLVVEIVDPQQPIRIRQYPIPLEGRRGLKPVIDRLLQKWMLEPCMSPHNTPILPVKKADGSYRLVQDLRAVNQ